MRYALRVPPTQAEIRGLWGIAIGVVILRFLDIAIWLGRGESKRRRGVDE